MIRLILLTVILSLKLTVSSALGTVSTIDTNIAPIPVQVGKQIVKDIIKGDSARDELRMYQIKDSLQTKTILKKDSLIFNLQDEVLTYKSLYNTEKVKSAYKDTIIQSTSNQVEYYKKEAKAQKRAKRASQGLMGFGIAALVALAFIF